MEAQMGIHSRFTAEVRRAEWHETPAVLAVIANIDIHDLYLRRPCLVMSADQLVITGSPVEVLDRLRAEHASNTMGSFENAADKRAYIAAMGPDARDVLADSFGDPSRFNGYCDEDATRQWRWDFEARGIAA
jgi:hypothetical protein